MGRPVRTSARIGRRREMESEIAADFSTLIIVVVRWSSSSVEAKSPRSEDEREVESLQVKQQSTIGLKPVRSFVRSLRFSES